MEFLTNSPGNVNLLFQSISLLHDQHFFDNRNDRGISLTPYGEGAIHLLVHHHSSNVKVFFMERQLNRFLMLHHMPRDPDPACLDRFLVHDKLFRKHRNDIFLVAGITPRAGTLTSLTIYRPGLDVFKSNRYQISSVRTLDNDFRGDLNHPAVFELHSHGVIGRDSWRQRIQEHACKSVLTHDCARS